MEERTGRIVKGIGGLYFVECGGEILPCRARGVFRHDDTSPQAGDLVDVGLSPDGEPVILSIRPRKNLLIRPALANLDLLLVCIPAACPEPDLRTVDKLTAIAVHNGIQTAAVVTKSGLNPGRAADLAAIYRTAFPAFVTDSLTGPFPDDLADFLTQRLKNRVCAFSGASGAGKSTLLNRLCPGLGLETGSVSQKSERGRHTTRKVELFPMYGGYLADTPGFTLLDFRRFDFMTKEDLPGSFPEFAPCLGRCRYTKCSHTKEEGCAVLAALSEGKIAKSRHESYLELYGVLKDKHEWDRKK